MSDDFTGERLQDQSSDFAVDMERHLAAYRYAAERAQGRSVLDAGCGEGYGVARLARVARRALGVDRDEPLRAARARYQAPTLEYRPFDLERLDTLGEQFELVVSCQVIEHLPDPVAFLRHLRTRVAPGGTLIVTTPNRLMTVGENPFHLREWTAPELLALATPVLPGVRILGMHGSPRVMEYERARGAAVDRILKLDPLNLRRFLPGWVIHQAFPRLAKLVRRQLTAGGKQEAVGPEDFFVGEDDLDRALDLVLLLEDAR